MRIVLFFLFLFIPLIAQEDFIAGEAIYTDSNSLPANAKFEAVLEDISKMDIVSETIGKMELSPVKKMPIAFKISFDDAKIKLGHSYAVRAKITENGLLLYTTDTINPVFTGKDNKHLNLIMKRVAKVPKSRLMEGMYKYMPDAVLFKECLTGKYYPVAYEGDNVALEEAYLKEMNGSNIFLKVELEGKIVKRPKMEGDSHEDMLLVERFIRVMGHKDCTEQRANIPITNNYWKLTELYGKKVNTAKDTKEAHILLKRGVNGVGELKVVTGCNTVVGNYKIEENTIKLRASSFEKKRVSCEDKMQEKEFVSVLDNTTYWRIEGETLKFYDEMDNVLATFEAVFF